MSVFLKVLRPSGLGNNKRKDAVYGNGIYFTTMEPSTAKKKIAKNNYDGTKVSPAMMKKVEMVVIIDIPESKLRKCETNSDDRDIYIFDTEQDLKLDDYHGWKIIEV